MTEDKADIKALLAIIRVDYFPQQLQLCGGKLHFLDGPIRLRRNTIVLGYWMSLLWAGFLISMDILMS